MGERADDIFSTFTLTEDQGKDYEVVVEKFENYFMKKRNPIFERAKFNQRVQLTDESVDSSITDLYNLGEHCQYGTLTEELIRDRLVVGLRNAKLSEKLQMNPELTLAKAVDQARLDEAVKKQQSVVGDSTSQTSNPEPKVEFVQKKFKKKKNPASKAMDKPMIPFQYRCVKLWNDLDTKLKQPSSTNNFKRNLKKSLLNKFLD